MAQVQNLKDIYGAKALMLWDIIQHLLNADGRPHKTQAPNPTTADIVRACLRPGMCYILVLMELQHICGTDTQGDKSLLDAWAEMR